MSVFNWFYYYSNETKNYEIYSNAINTYYRCNVDEYYFIGRSRVCSIGDQTGNDKTKFVLWGNSHMQMYAPIFHKVSLEKDVPGILIPLNSCLPLNNINRDEDCAIKAEENFKTLKTNFQDVTVFLAMTWHHTRLWSQLDKKNREISPKDYVDSLENLRDALALNGIKLIVVGPILRPDFPVASFISRGIKFGYLKNKDLNEILISQPGSEDFYWMMKIIKQLKESSLFVVYPHLEFCDKKSCKFGNSNEIYFSDSSHLSRQGLNSLKRLEKAIEEKF